MSEPNEIDKLPHRVMMVANIQRYFLEQLTSPLVSQYIGRGNFLKNESRMMNIATNIMMGIGYSRELKNIFHGIESAATRSIYKEFGDLPMDRAWKRMNRDARNQYFVAALNLFFDEARKIFPGLVAPDMQVKKATRYGLIRVNNNEAGSAKPHPLFVSPVLASQDDFYQATNMLFREALHSVLAQAGELHVNGKLSLNENLSRDMVIAFARAANDFVATRDLPQLYKLDSHAILMTQVGDMSQLRLKRYFNSKGKTERADRHVEELRPLINRAAAGLSMPRKEEKQLIRLGIAC